MEDLRADLAAEHEALDGVVAGLDASSWDVDTPAAGWRVRDQIGHLTFFDRQASFAADDPAGFEAGRDAALADLRRFEADAGAPGREHSGAALLQIWRQARSEMLERFARLDPSARVPWYGPPMGAKSFVSARLMETWAHGQDVVDALGATRPATDRLRHVAHIGVRTRAWSYVVRGRQVPDGEVVVESTAPDGVGVWTWGDLTAAGVDRIAGTALDFCLVVTQRRHPADTGLVSEGDLAAEWLSIAQAFAGGPGPGRRAGQFARTP